VAKHLPPPSHSRFQDQDEDLDDTEHFSNPYTHARLRQEIGALEVIKDGWDCFLERARERGSAAGSWLSGVDTEVRNPKKEDLLWEMQGAFCFPFTPVLGKI
jgi:hypothetical protein